MPSLIILSHAPHSDPGEARMVALARDGDTVLLIEDAVYGAGAVSTPLASAIEEGTRRGVSFIALKPDADARGVASKLPTVDYTGFVDLIASHDRAVH